MPNETKRKPGKIKTWFQKVKRKFAHAPLSEEGKISKPILTTEQQEELNKQFIEAAKYGRTDDARKLARLGANVNFKDNASWAAIHYAACNGWTETCRVLVKELGADVNSKEQAMFISLHMAAMNGETETCRVLKELGADVNAKDIMGWTALHYATEKGQTETCRVMCRELSANPLLKNKDGRTPRDLTFNPKIKKLLEKWENVWKSVGEKKVNALFSAVKECWPEKIKEIFVRL